MNEIVKSNDAFRNILLAVCFLSLFLFLGQTYFHTPGEPREALVASAMLDTGDVLSPITNGVDLAYKPPLFHWCITLLSACTAEVTEYTSRMPSALALTGMAICFYLFVARYIGTEQGLLAGLLLLSNFEVHRAGVNCRVDMLLAALLVIAVLRLYDWKEKEHMRGLPLGAILAMSGAVLTKGPVGVVLPCLVLFIHLFFYKRPCNPQVGKSLSWQYGLLRIVVVGVLACLLPLLWYVAAYLYRGDRFLQLVLEENVWRFLGKMSYASHENPAWYNVVTVVTGFLPYTLLALFGLFALPYASLLKKLRTWWHNRSFEVSGKNPHRLYMAVAVVVIFVFYCIPKSKRSVYLLPIYPFLAYFLAEYLLYLVRNKSRLIAVFGGIMASLGILLTATFFVVRGGLVPHSLFGGRHAAENIAYLTALETCPMGIVQWLLVVLPALAAIGYFVYARNMRKKMYTAIAVVFVLFFALDGFYQPTVLNVKSNKKVAEQIAVICPSGPVYSYITQTAKENRMHPFTINFYLKGRVVPFVEQRPVEGYLILGEREYDGFVESYKDYELTEVYDPHHRSCDERDRIRLYMFSKKGDRQ